MINVLQLIVSFPLFSLYFPANALFVYGLIVDISKMNLLPTNTMNKNVFAFSSDKAFNDAFNNLDIFETT